ncbi:MAG: class I SAM-dependent DNA methyltransferase [Bacteroidales bacterium]|nr:class I SAM-dependent DNA methyltransferase [Bacteroidales bacterium]
MAKKNKGTFSYIEAQQALENIAEKCTKENIVYELLSIFCGYGNASIQRIIDGRGNDAKDGRTILVKKLIAYRATDNGLFGDDNLYEIIEAMQKDSSIYKKEPRLYVASDGKRIIAYDPKEEDLYDNDISLMWKDFEFFKPLAGIEKFRNIEESEADVKSAEMMAKIYDDIRRYNDVHDRQQIHNINVFMTRLLFCFFAEDTGLFPCANMFTTAIRQDTKADGTDLAEFLDGIFDIMAIEDKQIRASLPNKITQFPYVNGGLFKTHIPIPILSRRTRMLMLKCGEYNWAEINPDIFGSMIQAVINPDDRAGMGIHYTSVPNIMKVIRPLFLDELTEEFVRVKDDAKKLNALMMRLSKIKFFDPACGSGNFLIIAYKSIRELEIQIWKRLRELGSTQLPFSNISLTQFYGIEIDEYACDTAKLSLWLAEHQVNNLFWKELGSKVDALPLGKSGNIVCGNACRLDWNTVCPHTADEEVYVMGNPQYKGFKYQSEQQKEDKDIIFKHSHISYKKLDYIVCWFVLGSRYATNTKTRIAFVSTNSISQGDHLSIWKSILSPNMEISFAYKSFKWKNNAKDNATVMCVIIGLQSPPITQSKRLYDDNSYTILTQIPPTLSETTDIIVEKKSSPISDLPEMILGSLPADGGFLIFEESDYHSLVKKSPQIAILLKRFIGSGEIVKNINRYCLWADESYKELLYSIPELKDRLDNVSEYRRNSSKESTKKYAAYPYLFTERRYFAKEAIVVPITTSERREYIPVDIATKDSVIYHSACAIYDYELWHLGVLTSKIHNVWIRATVGRLETRIRYSATLCYNTFPFPKINDEQKQRLSALAENILLTRENHTEMTLGEMYNPESMPDDLKEAHKALDIAVEQCYRTEPFTSDDERLEYLFKLYERMTKKK